MPMPRARKLAELVRGAVEMGRRDLRFVVQVWDIAGLSTGLLKALPYCRCTQRPFEVLILVSRQTGEPLLNQFCQ
jgi:hypothetical protein